jgi:LmbE family N-acetylglucosaminyl deacetylase
VSHLQTARPLVEARIGRLVALSPHCDDAVFGCGGLLARHPGAVVLTIFAGRPPVYGSLTRWDEAAGFGPGDDVVAARRAEDRAALATLGATPVWLEFLDSQYGRSPSATEVAAAVETGILAANADAVIVPLGLFHADHHLAHESALVVACRHPELVWLAYEDAIYRRVSGLIEDRIDRLRDAGFRLVAADLRVHDVPDVKRRAVACYGSQLRALSAPGFPGCDDVFEPERFWNLTRYTSDGLRAPLLLS